MKYKYLFIISVVAFVCCVSCNSGNSVGNQSPRVKVLDMSRNFFSSYLNYTGTVNEGTSAALSFEFPGTVTNVYVANGDKVYRGQVLATIDETTMRSAYETAKALLDQAQDASDRLSSLRNKRAVAEVQWVEIQTKLSEARSMYDAAKDKLDKCKLRAPIDGVVSVTALSPGQVVVPGIEHIKVVNLNKMRFAVNVPEADYVRIHQGIPARITVNALGGREYRSVVSEISPLSNNLTHSYTVKMDADNSDSALYPGMICEVSLNLSAEVENNDAAPTIITLPAKSIMLTENNEHYVWVVNNQSKAERRFVKVGAATTEGIVITSGLDDQDRVIIEGYLRLSEGCVVTVVE